MQSELQHLGGARMGVEECDVLVDALRLSPPTKVQ